jgi:hypothetical protein
MRPANPIDAKKPPAKYKWLALRPLPRRDAPSVGIPDLIAEKLRTAIVPTRFGNPSDREIQSGVRRKPKPSSRTATVPVVFAACLIDLWTFGTHQHQREGD